jgi:CrcB protein
MLKELIIVGLGGGIGSILRYLSSLLVNRHYSADYPWATFIVNIVGCLLIGLFIGLSARHGFFNKELKLLLITGFCGGYTTFSTFSSENWHLLESGSYFTLASYILLSVIIGVVAVWAGMLLTK